MITLAEFIATAPLYSWRQVELPKYVTQLDPGQVILRCAACGGDRPFRDHRSSGGGLGTPPLLGTGPYYLPLTCGFCSKEVHMFLVETDPERQRIRKVGQLPPWSLEVSPDVAAHLGSDLDLYRKGLACLSQGYGLGACAYFRRVLENRVDSILDLLLVYLTLDDSGAEAAAQIRTIRQGKVADKKLQEVHPYFPEALRVAGHNPVKLLYEQLSEAMHVGEEDESCALAQRLSGTLAYVLTELQRATTARERFIASVKEIASGSKPAATPGSPEKRGARGSGMKTGGGSPARG
jgi:hypothetical protein